MVAQMKRHEFTAVFTPDDNGAWNVSIPEVDGCFTWGRSLSEAKKNIREALEASLDDANRKAIASKAIIVSDIRLPSKISEYVEQARSLKKAYEAASAKKHAAEVLSAATLTRQSLLSLRDVGEILGYSPEGVRKLLKDAPPVRSRRTA